MARRKPTGQQFFSFDAAAVKLPPTPGPTPEEAKAAAMAKVAAASDPDWCIRALAAVRAVAARLDEFTTDDVWDQLKDDVPREPRAMGPVMDSAARAGVCRKTERTKPSRSRVNHGRDVRVWASVRSKDA